MPSTCRWCDRAISTQHVGVRFYDVRDAAAYRETMVEENAVDPIESSEQLHNEWLEPVASTPEWSAPAAAGGSAHGRQGLAAPGWWPSVPGWKKEDGIMSSIAEGDENSESLAKLFAEDLGRQDSYI